ncbi:TRAP transporter TatT component family protein [Desulfuromonas acetoxidans]|uniref:TRAP transporter TatT component family protein n=1 Tax=Desulfuromonas acetoxidans TaxID=891 RepID=UPI00292F01B9|nr:TRAP transporter TatT component family protein [Desulfuromonas acetoxidans]
MRYFSKHMLLILTTFLLSGCAKQWQPSWNQTVSSNNQQPVEHLLEQAREKYAKSDNGEKLSSSIQAYQSVLKADPNNYEALQTLSTQYILLGTAYTEKRAEKAEYFKQAIVYAEWAMYTNPQFREKIEQGMKPWQAADALTARESEAMLFWVTAIQYEFKEVMSLYAKIINVDRLNHALTIINRIQEVNPQFGGGAVEFCKAICYYALPSSKGGDKQKGDLAMQQAVTHGEKWLLPRWALGKYYYPIRGEDIKAQQELAWVASQDITKYNDPLPWRVHFRENAQQLLQ